MTDARNSVTALVFDAAGRNTVVVDPDGDRTTFGYAAADRLTTMTDPLSHSATYAYAVSGEKGTEKIFGFRGRPLFWRDDLSSIFLRS